MAGRTEWLELIAIGFDELSQVRNVFWQPVPTTIVYNQDRLVPVFQGLDSGAIKRNTNLPNKDRFGAADQCTPLVVRY
jgi:hypothetical protein